MHTPSPALSPLDRHIANSVAILQASPHGATLAQRFAHSTNPIDQAIGAAYELAAAGVDLATIVPAPAQPVPQPRTPRGKPRKEQA
jgi:hypothetical protein